MRVSDFIGSVIDSVTTRKKRGYNLGAECGDKDVVGECLKMLEKAGVVYTIEEAGCVWIQMMEKEDTAEDNEEMAKKNIDDITKLVHLFI